MLKVSCFSLEYGNNQVSAVSIKVCGEFLIRYLVHLMMLQSLYELKSCITKRSNSATSSDSVGSIIKVPATEKKLLEHENQSIKRFAISETSIPFL
jgi:hypothetical protein